ncbi:Vacuolar fusion protein CCZ1 homolog [Geodia barretti]|nr:Vacuolar fusion protein CCZ1 homolog [Geodia barretti]
MTVSIPWVEQVNNGERTVQYIQDYVQDEVLETALQRSYSMFKLFHGSYTDVCNQAGQEGLRARLQRFYSRYLQTIDVDKLDIFSIFQGMQFLPLDKYMYLKAHCFVNLVETTYRNIQRTVFLYGDQLVWSGLGQEDIQIFYQYLLTWLFPNWASENPALVASLNPLSQHSSLSLSSPPISSSLPASHPSIALTNVTGPGGFILGQPGTGDQRKSPWVYVTVDGLLQGCKLFVFNVGSATMCFFVKSLGKNSPSADFCKKLGTFLNPRLSQISREIADFIAKSKTPSTEQLYKYVYFNEMNLAVKSSRSSRRSPSPSHHISPEAMRIIIDLNREYNELDEGETIMRTLSDFWVVCRKSGHRRFFVILTQKNANFAEINEEVRKLCQREFTNIFFLD